MKKIGGGMQHGISGAGVSGSNQQSSQLSAKKKAYHHQAMA